MAGVQADLVGNPEYDRAGEMLSLARDIERLSVSDPVAAAAALGELCVTLRSIPEPFSGSGTALAHVDQVDERLEDLARRLRTGHVKGVGGLERHIRRVLIAAGVSVPPTLRDSAPNR
jgi:hypothetical protein